MGDISNTEGKILQSEPLKLQPKTAELREKIIQTNNKPILLRKNSSEGEPLYLLISSSEYDPTKDWKHERMTTSRCMVLASVFTERTGEGDKKELFPIGFCNFQIIDGDNVVGGGNMPTAEIYKLVNAGGKPMERSYFHWKNRAASFGVDPSYQKQGLGSFMLAASMISLYEHGARRIGDMILLEPAINTFKNFDMKEGKTSKGSGGRPIMRLDQNKYAVRDLVAHPYTEKIVSAFI